MELTDLERPIDEGETGCFTVAAEGDEKVFGPDGGRDNELLGLIEASFRRELPTSANSYPEMPEDLVSRVCGRVSEWATRRGVRRESMR